MNDSTKSPTRRMIDFETNRVVTQLGDWKIWQLGPASDSEPVDCRSQRPYLVHVRWDSGAATPSFGWVGWSCCVVTNGSVSIGDRAYGPGEFAMASPFALSGPVVAGEAGCELLMIVDRGASMVQVFEHPNAGGLSEHLERLGLDRADRDLSAGSWDKLDTVSDVSETPWYSSKTWEVGPLGFRTGRPEEAVSDYPVIGFAFVEPVLESWPAHRHDGYSALYVLRGSYHGGGPDFVAGELEMTYPTHIVSGDQRPGRDGTHEIVFFDGGHGAVPVVIEQSERAAKFNALHMLG